MIFTAKTHDGKDIVWKDTKRYLWIISIIVTLIPAACSLALFYFEMPIFAAGPLLSYYGLIPALDYLIGEDPNNPPEEIVDKLAQDNWYRILIHIAVVTSWINFLIVAVIIGTVSMPIWAYIVLSIGTGIASGSGLTLGHELGHKSNRIDQWGAKLACALTGYGHFIIEHNRGHHTFVATPEDPASARMGESILQFASRELPMTARRGVALEKRRLRKQGHSFWSLHNNILHVYAIAAIIALPLIIAYGLVMIPFLLIHHFYGWLTLTFANYVEHYGLKREKLPNGSYQPCEPHHSWNTNHIVSNLLLFHLQRHSDHHANPMRPYQVLRNFDELPTLPSGYPGSFLLASFPSLWFKVMDPKVVAWAGGDMDKINIHPNHEKRLRKAYG